MKKLISLFLLLVLASLILFGLYFLDKDYFLCPIEYRRDIVIRNDSRGDGFFAANRNGRRVHEGLDLFAELGTPVLASRSGLVVAATQNNGMGKYVIIQHSNNTRTIYGHLSKINARRDQFIRQGQVIGYVGKTGNANNRDILPHLHFEVKKDGVPQDPLGYLR
ncbi:MAG: M23 family metallopeptidase [Candidatus Omnitrophica bacterium]|nr:M23 family metallopeptidase [Candidatus Omnitrophota bacterium]